LSPDAAVVVVAVGAVDSVGSETTVRIDDRGEAATNVVSTALPSGLADGHAGPHGRVTVRRRRAAQTISGAPGSRI
jgi:hypothetical protein